MLNAFQALLVLAIVFTVAFPADAANGVAYVQLWLYSRALNYYLMFKAWRMYCHLKADFAKMGLPIPAFKFVPIWERHGSN